jgi:hypothetical protein
MKTTEGKIRDSILWGNMVSSGDNNERPLRTKVRESSLWGDTVSRPKSVIDSESDRHANTKPVPDINTNQLKGV